MLTGVVCVASVGVVALLIALHRRVQQIPARLRALLVHERTKALDSLEQETAVRVGTITLALRAYHEQMEARVRSEIAAAEVRARVAERRASDAVTALEAASGLVRELRAMIDHLRGLRPAGPAAPEPAGAAVEPVDERKTVEMKRTPAPAEEAAEEPTAVITNPSTSVLAAKSGLRLGPSSPRSTIQPPHPPEAQG